MFSLKLNIYIIYCFISLIYMYIRKYHRLEVVGNEMYGGLRHLCAHIG